MSNPYLEQRRTGVESMLQQWAEAIRTNNSTALAALIDPSSAPDFLEAELRRAAALAAVPLSDWGYELVDEPETPVPSDIATSLGAADVWAPTVVLHYAISDIDTVPTRRTVSLLLAERDDQWRIVSDADVPGIDRHTWRGPWDFGPVTVTPVETAGGKSIILGHRDQASLVSQLVKELPAAVKAVTNFTGSDWTRKAVLFTTGSSDEFAASAGTSTASSGVAAVTVSDVMRPDSPISGQRVVFSPAAPERLTEFTTRSVLRHELTHIAVRAETVDGSPTWLLEGFADYAGYRGSGSDFTQLAPTLSAVVAKSGPPTVLPQDSDFAASGLRSTLAYESAWSVCAFVAERFGEPMLRALYSRLATGPKNAADVDAGLSSTTGLNTAQFVQAWGAWVQKLSS